ncbi:MAG: hypothetical protein H7Y11_08970, partial [Armatimonadetes bacterium]|nr:hypothetical protein [Anaerolineae bacterium]
MVGKHTIRNASYAAIVLVILTLTGIFDSFSERYVLAEALSLSTVLLIGSLVAVGFMSAHPERAHGTGAIFTASLIGTVIVGIGLSLTVLTASLVDLRFVFQNISTLSPSPLTFEQPNPVIGVLLLMSASVVCGV